ncbi:MAG: PfkB family carbohydrate kinase [Rhodoglobus sp.]
MSEGLPAHYPVAGARFLVVGDVIDDVLVVLDRSIRVDTDTAASIRQVPGGSAANTAAWLASVGQHVTFIGAVGADDVIRVAAALPGVEARLLATPYPTGAIVVLVEGQHRSMLTSRGANAHLDLGAINLDGFDVLHLTGHPLLQSTDGGEAFTALIARANTAGLVVSLDPGSAGFLADFGPDRFLAAVDGVDVLLPGLDEAKLLTGLDDPTEIVRALQFDTVVLKLGRAGAVVGGLGAEPSAVPAVETEVVDPTGAGDAFAAGFLAAWMVDRDAVAAARAASTVAARAVASAGGRP